jgi:hypothetical protein
MRAVSGRKLIANLSDGINKLSPAKLFSEITLNLAGDFSPCGVDRRGGQHDCHDQQDVRQ